MMSSASDLRQSALRLKPTPRFLRALTDRIDVYRRYVRAGLEIEALLSLTDQQLAARNLIRESVGREILDKHGIRLNRST